MKRFGKMVIGAVFSLSMIAGSMHITTAKAAADDVQIMLDNYPLPFPVATLNHSWYDNGAIQGYFGSSRRYHPLGSDL